MAALVSGIFWTVGGSGDEPSIFIDVSDCTGPPIWGSDLRIKKPSNTEEAVCTLLYLYCRSGRKFHKYGVEDANNKCGMHGWRKNIFNTYVIIETFHQPGQVHYATLCFVQLKEPFQILLQSVDVDKKKRKTVKEYAFNLYLNCTLSLLTFKKKIVLIIWSGVVWGTYS